MVPSWIELVCPACHGSLQPGEDWLQCSSCHTIYPAVDGILHFTNIEVLSEFEQGESLFHTQIAAQADDAHGQSTLRAQYLHDDFLEPIKRLPKGSVILDVACGSGPDVVYLAEQGYYVVGFDIAPGMVAITRQKVLARGLADRVFLFVGRASQIPCSDNTFDATSICAALHHMEDARGTLKELARVTRPGGILSAGSEPNAWIYRFRAVKHSRIGRRIMGWFRSDYTIGEQPPGDRETPGWRYEDWPQLVQGTGLKLARVSPIWYLNGVASLLGFKSPPRWFERLLLGIDRVLSHTPWIRKFSVKWNVIAIKHAE